RGSGAEGSSSSNGTSAVVSARRGSGIGAGRSSTGAGGTYPGRGRTSNVPSATSGGPSASFTANAARTRYRPGGTSGSTNSNRHLPDGYRSTVNRASSTRTRPSPGASRSWSWTPTARSSWAVTPAVVPTLTLNATASPP